jgi:CheY-like chemotaxis protein
MKTIVVVDDEFDILESIRMVLEEEGYRVEGCTDGKAGLQKIAALRPDLVFLDVMMPIMSGYEVLQFLEKDPTLSHIPVVMMSAVFPPMKQEDCGWHSFLRKPFELDSLLEMVAKHLGNKSAATRA